MSFIVVCGIDGSGKSTVLHYLGEKKPDYQFSHWRKFQELKQGVIQWGINPTQYVTSLSPLVRALWVAGCLWSEYELLIKPELEKGKTVISDSYYYKFWAKEKIYNRSDPVLYSLLRRLPKPDLIIMIDIAPLVACNRKKYFSAYETEGDSFEDHVIFQSKVRNELLKIIKKNHYVTINGNQDIQALFQDVEQALCLL